MAATNQHTEASVDIEYLHASRYGNGVTVAEEFRRQMAAKGVTVGVHHIRETRPDRLPTAGLYVFSSPGRIGKPIGDMRRFLKQVRLPAGTRYAVLTTELAPKPDKKTGQIPTEQEQARWQRVRPIMNELLQAAGLVKVAEDKVHVTGLKGPLEEGWQKKVEAFATRIPLKSRAPTTVLRRRGLTRPPVNGAPMLELDARPRPRRRTRSRPHLGGVMRQLEQHAQKVALPAERERIAEGLFEQSVQALLVVGLEL